MNKKTCEKAPLRQKFFEKSEYEGGAASTLCAGCGHDQISRQLIRACYEAQIKPFETAKLSGIGCSSKTPDYFLKRSQGFNTIHGRMAPAALGVKAAARNLKVIGVSGDGDTGSIGLGAFLHTIRQNIPMIYLVENNGVYGLTKGQLSATAKPVKSEDSDSSLNLCLLALSAGCGFVARAFSGDGKQLLSLLKAAFKYPGFAFIDVISPCTAYGNEPDFPHSFSFMRENRNILNELNIIEGGEPVQIDLKEGESKKILLPDGSVLVLKKLSEKDHDPENFSQALSVASGLSEGALAAGLIYHAPKRNFFQKMNLISQPLNSLKEEEIRLSNADLKNALKQFA